MKRFIFNKVNFFEMGQHDEVGPKMEYALRCLINGGWGVDRSKKTRGSEISVKFNKQGELKQTGGLGFQKIL